MPITDTAIAEENKALSPERTKLMTLENEIINYFHHLASCDNPSLQIKQFPSQIKRLLKEWDVLGISKGQLWELREDNNPSNQKRIDELKEFIETKEKDLRFYFYREEILGT